MFDKRIDLYKKRDKETWLQIKAALKEAGFKGMRSGHYLQDTVLGGGCGAKLDPRDFGPRGRIDREIYWIDVKEKDEEAARSILRQNGLVAEVDKDVMIDAALRKKPTDKYYPSR